MTEFHCLGLAALCLHFLDVLLALNPDSRENAVRVMLDPVQHGTEHFVWLWLVFLFRIFLRVNA